VVIEEKDAGQAIEASALGVCSMIGPWERGEISTPAAPKLNYCSTRGLLDKKMGGRVDFSSCPDAAQDFFQHSQGAGEVIAIRITDGTEQTPHVDLYSRHWGTDFHASTTLKGGQSQVKQAVLRVSAKNAGRWGGRRKVLTGTYNPATDLDETTLETGLVMAVDEWKDATLVLEGVEFKTYTVVSNTADGILTVKGDSTMLTDMGASVATGFSLFLDSEILDDNNRKGLGIRIKEAARDPSINFGLDVYVDGFLVYGWDTLSMDPTSSYYVESLINKDIGNAYVSVEDLIPGGTAIVPDLRPANLYGKLRSLSTSTAEYNTGCCAEITDANNKIRFLRAWVDPEMLTGIWASFGYIPAIRLTLVWDDTAHKYTVEATSIRQPANLDDQDFTDWAIGAGEQLHQTYSYGPYNILVDHNGEPDDGARLVVDFLPVEEAIAVGAALAPNKDRPVDRFRVRVATATTTEVEAGDLTNGAGESTLAEVAATEEGPYTIVAGVNDSLIITVDELTLAQVTVTLPAGVQTASTICTTINGVFPIWVSPANLNTAGTGIVFRSQGTAGRGKYSTIEFDASSTCLTTLGLTAGKTSGTEGTAPTTAYFIGTAAEPFAIVAVTNDEINLQIDGRKAVLTALTPGPARTAQNIVDDINAAFDAVYGAGILNPASVYTDPDTGDKYVKLTSSGHEGGGPASTIAVLAETHDAAVTLGLPAKVMGMDPVIYGNTGGEAECMYGDEPGDGHDGGSVPDTKYLEALSISMSPINKIAGKGKGVVQIACPGVTSTTVQKAGLDFCEAKNHVFVVTVPESITDEQAAVDYINTTIGRNDFGVSYFPSFVEVVDPDGEGALKTIPFCGEVLGRDAMFARNYGGYHQPAAGQDCTFPRIIRLPTTGADNEDAVLNEEILNPVGLNVIKKIKGNYVLWGCRTISRSTTWIWKNHRLQMSHYEQTFMESFDWVIFALNTPALWAVLTTAFQVFFMAEWKKGAIKGDKFTDACSIKIDQENNTAADEATGDLYADIGLRFPYAVERFHVRMSKLGLFESTSS
jgi:hypothetical protein